MSEITKETYNKLKTAGQTLCSYCENDACERCIVTLLMDQSEEEALESGIIEEY